MQVSSPPMSTTRVWAAVETVDYGRVIAHRQPLWMRALERFETRGSPSSRRAFDAFCLEQTDWLDEYALFMAVKEAHGMCVTKTYFSMCRGVSQLMTAFSSECRQPQFPASSRSQVLGKPVALPL
jgi:4-alpha-glucanotransferase